MFFKISKGPSPISTALQGFVKGSSIQAVRATKNCVIYTRVSSKEQAEGNSSLGTQKRFCEEYCQKQGFTVQAFFGGTFESAKDDERKEFKRMLEYVRRNKSIDTILVYSYDRFSRSGTNAAYLSQELQKTGVRVIAVSQQIDTSSPSGKLHRDMLYLFSQFDNELRKDKVVNGMIENLRQGYWVSATPFGYTNKNRKEKARFHQYEINREGELLQEAFKLKAAGGMTNKDIVARLIKKGSRINYKSFVRIISNPFYCGYITHSLIPGEIYKGHHPALVSEKLFVAANRVVREEPRSAVPKLYKVDDLPLKIFASGETSEVAEASGISDGSVSAAAPFTGYIQKGIYYYKTRSRENPVNVKASHLNGLFMEELRKFEYNKKQARNVRSEITRLLNEKLSDYFKEQVFSKKQLTELNNKIEKLEERFINGDIPKELYEKYLLKFKNEKEELKQKSPSQGFDSSNLEMIIDKGLKLAENLSSLWLSRDFDDKQKLQRLIFPEGIVYNKKKDRVRTIRVNSLFEPIPYLTGISGENEKSHPVKNGSKSHLVVPARIELASKV